MVLIYCYKLHKISLNRDASYIDSLEWLKNKKAKINPINKKYDNCFQYTITAALKYEEKNNKNKNNKKNNKD